MSILQFPPQTETKFDTTELDNIVSKLLTEFSMESIILAIFANAQDTDMDTSLILPSVQKILLDESLR